MEELSQFQREEASLTLPSVHLKQKCRCQLFHITAYYHHEWKYLTNAKARKYLMT